MAFATKIGNILKTTVNKNIKIELSASHPSIYQAIRFMSSSKVFIGGLSYGMDETSLKDAFTQYGEVVDSRIITDYETGRSRGFGFVTFTSNEDASAAISGMDGKDLHGRIVKVDYAHDRTGGFRDGYGGGGGGGYGGAGGYGGSGGGGYGGAGGYGGSGGGGGFGGGSYGGGVGNYSGGGNYGGDSYRSNGGGGYSRGSGGDSYDSSGGGSYATGDSTYGSSYGGGSTGGYGGSSGAENYSVTGGSNDSHVSGASSDNYASGGSGSGYGGLGGLDHGDNQGSTGTSGYNQGDPLDRNYKEGDVDELDDYADKRG